MAAAALLDGARDFALNGGSRRWLAASAAVVAILLTVAISRFGHNNSPSMGYLFTDLEPAAAKAITERLAQSNVPFTLSADGSAVLAPVERLAGLRMELAGAELAGPVGYGVLDAESPLGLSDQRARINMVRAIEGELARSIATIDAVLKARVHLALPERALFVREPRPATASVTVRTRSRLSTATVHAIRALVAGAVPGLAAERVSVVDQNGRLLSGTGGDAAALDDRQTALETRLREEVEALVERATGSGRVRVQVAADLSRASRRDESERFDPDGNVVARSTTMETLGDSREGEAAQAASVATQLPDRTAAPAAAGDLRTSANRETSEETQFNSSRTASTVMEDAGRLTRLSVSVLVDPKTAAGRTLAPADVAQLRRLVQTAVGFDADRGDQVTIELMPLVPAITSDGTESTEAASGAIPQWAIGVAAALLLLLAALAALFWRRRTAQRKAEPVAINGEIVLREMASSPDNAAVAIAAEQQRLPAPSPRAALDELLQQVSSAISANPDSAAAALRRMMTA
ncbi:flagellar basal-body MS-ring/collar protein FliF [Sandaracinobacteroides saxicola]|uniref:Flagellar M-ring protein n=1 Tax=Sandaracinobacteroides saxicola TaxID=2759707 RepID=A0A7G5IJZ6_9SPHN|nr:flagellar basal-body MS-ring/collar protein FliF [Sandaracinobacteroides saxicola]QMW23688.1 flagellar M-ring protein FliF [Sandaracinobacteroides saxicola]